MVMPPIKDSKTLVAAGADKEEGRRPTIVSAPDAASPELLDRPRRRTFTAQDKLRILGEADRVASVPGAVGAIVAVFQGLRLCVAKAEAPEAYFTFECANLQQISDAAQPLDDSQRRRRMQFVLYDLRAQTKGTNCEACSTGL